MKKSIFLFPVLLLLLAQPAALYNQDRNARQEPGSRENPDILLVLDNSGSMKKNDPKFLTREVALNFLKNIDKESRLGLVIFAREAILAEPLTGLSNANAGERFLKSLAKINYKGRWTNSPAAIERAIYELKTNGGKDAQKVIIFLTDGIVETGNKSRDIEKLKWLKEDLTDDCKKSGIRIFAIAFTEKADFSLIQTLAHKTGGQYFRVYKAEEIEETFTKIKNAIGKKVVPETGKSQPTPVSFPASPSPSPKAMPSPLPIIAGGVVVILVVVSLLLLLRGKNRAGKIEIGLPGPLAKLIDEQGMISEKAIELKKGTVRIGRGSDNDIIISKRTVSAFHATIKHENNCYYLEDQRSSNFTRLNGEKIKPNTPMRLKSGDVISFDVYRFRFLLPFEALAGETILHHIADQPKASGTIIRKLEDLDKEKEKEKSNEPNKNPVIGTPPGGYRGSGR